MIAVKSQKKWVFLTLFAIFAEFRIKSLCVEILVFNKYPTKYFIDDPYIF